MRLNVTLRQIRAFVAVARNGSYSKAARAIGLSQPALTMNVRSLEEALQVKLLDRDTRNVEVTEAGKDFLATAERLVGEFDAFLDDTTAAGQHLSGEVVVASVPSLASSLVGPVMTRFKGTYQGITVKLFDGDEQRVAHRVGIRQADFGLCGPIDDDSDIKFQPLVYDDFCAIFPQGHPLGDLQRVRLRDVVSYPFLVMGRDTGVRHALERALVRNDLRLNVLCELEQISTLSGMIEAGIGVSAVPALTLPIVRHTNIDSRRLVDPTVRRDLGLVSRRRRTLSPAAECFRNAVLSFVADGWLDSIADAVGNDTVHILPAARKLAEAVE